MKSIKTICFDADDTLWENEVYFRAAEERFCALMADYAGAQETKDALLKQEFTDIPYYGFGVKGFTFSMIQTAINLSKGKIKNSAIEEIMGLSKNMLMHPVELIEGVENTLLGLKGKYRLALATKGDLQHQEYKINNSGLAPYFDFIEILSDKKEDDYLKIIGKYSINPSEFAMVGNSVKSDIIPVLNIGSFGFHIPHKATWAHEAASVEGLPQDRFIPLARITELTGLLGS